MPESGAPRVRSLADELRSWAVEGLTRLLDERPDLLNPVPTDLRDLALRAGSAHSVGLCLDRMSGTELVALEVLAAHEQPVTREQLVAALQVSPDTAESLLTRFRSLALTWGYPTVHLVRAVADSFGPYPCHLMPPLAHTRSSLRKFAEEPSSVDSIVGTLSATARKILTQVANTGPLMNHPEASRLSQDTATGDPAAELVKAGLLIAIDERTLAVPREVALPLRQGPWAQIHVPAADATPPDPQLLDVACDQAARAVTQVRALISMLTHQPIKLGRNLTPHRPDVTRSSEHLGWTVEHTKLVISVAIAADLLGASERPQDCLAVTTKAASWHSLDMAEQWLSLCKAWHQRPELIVTSVTRESLDRHGYPAAALENAGAAFSAWGSITAAGGSADPATLKSVRPRLAERASEQFIAVTAVTSWLGLSARDCLSPLGHALAAHDDDEALRLFASSLGPVIDSFYLQPDHTVIVPGRLTQEVRQRLLSFSVIESDDRALVTRLTPTSLRHGLERGETPDTILDFLRNHSHTGVPQSLEYQIVDLARRPRKVEITPSACVLRFGDSGMRAEAMKTLQSQGIAVVEHGDETLTTRQPVERVMGVLVAAGFAVEGGDVEAHSSASTYVATRDLWADRPSPVSSGAIANALVSSERQGKDEGHSKPAERSSSGARIEITGETHLDAPHHEIADRREVGAQDQVRATQPGDTVQPMADLAPSELIPLFSEAAHAGQSVTIEYVDRSGRGEIVHAIPLHIDHGFVTVFDLTRQQVRTLTVSRVSRLATES